MDEDGQTLTDGTADRDLNGQVGAEMLAVVIGEAGTYRVEVRSYGDEAGSFTVGASFVAMPGLARAPDPDGRPSRARTLGIGTAHTDEVHPDEGDQWDWYTVTVTEPVAEDEKDNFFLVSIVEQWKRADNKEMPPLIQADRALALAYEQNRLAKNEFLAQAEWALADDKLEAAAGLFDAARKLDPNDVEAQAGLRVVNKLKEGSPAPLKADEKGMYPQPMPGRKKREY